MDSNSTEINSFPRRCLDCANDIEDTCLVFKCIIENPEDLAICSEYVDKNKVEQLCKPF